MSADCVQKQGTDILADQHFLESACGDCGSRWSQVVSWS
jgi:hypothetical protein